MYTFSKKSVEDLIYKHGGNPLGKRNGKDIWVLKDSSLIQIPTGFKRISFLLLKRIALDQLEISEWELDYWLGENGK